MADVHEQAEALKDFFSKNPEGTIDQAVEALAVEELGPQGVAEILNTHYVDDDGIIQNLGFGQGGGWAPPVSMVQPATEIGFRWPDDTLHDTQFDITDAAHRQQVGIKEEDYARMKQAAE